MMAYRYRAYDAAGALHLGQIEATCEADAIADLASRGRYASHVIPLGDEAGSRQRWWDIELWSPGAVNGLQRAALLRDLATLAEAGIPVEEALRLLRNAGSISARGVSRIVAGLHGAVIEGAALSDAMAKLGDTFPEFIWQLVKAGERSGKLASVLADIAAFEEAQARRQSELSQALLYPAILLLAAAGALGVVMFLLVPTLLPLFKDAGVAPPLLVGLMATTMTWIASNWPIAAASVAGLMVACWGAGRTEDYRQFRDRLLLSMPLVSRLIADQQITRFAKTLSTLLVNGVPLAEAARAVTGVLDNRIYRAGLSTLGARLETGLSLSQALQQIGLLDELHVRLIGIGEHTGGLAAMLQRIGAQCEERARRRLDGLMAMLAPVLTLLIGGVVGGLILSVMSAITGLNDLVLK